MGMISDSFRGFWVVLETAGYLTSLPCFQTHGSYYTATIGVYDMKSINIVVMRNAVQWDCPSER